VKSPGVVPSHFLQATLLLLAAIASGLLAGPLGAETQKESGVYVVLWFDTEDYILPQDDDATKWIANFLIEQNVQDTFKMVG